MLLFANFDMQTNQAQPTNKKRRAESVHEAIFDSSSTKLMEP